jgi:biotin carboxyl carrier protein
LFYLHAQERKKKKRPSMKIPSLVKVTKIPYILRKAASVCRRNDHFHPKQKYGKAGTPERESRNCPSHISSVSSIMGGHIKSINVINGSHFSKGQVLAVVEDPQFIQLQQDYLVTKAQLEAAD